MEQSAVLALGSAGERITYGEADIIFKSPAPSNPDGWTVVDYTLPARQFGAPLHYHRELTESFYVMEGALWMRVGDKETLAGPGSFILIPPGTLHAFANKTDAPVRFLGHASSPRHKDFLCELFHAIQREPAWPPPTPEKYLRMGERYDTIYV